MKRPHFRFQTKLMVAVMAAIVLVTFAVMVMTERKVRATYQATAEAQFKEQVNRITELRRLRLEGAGRLLERISEFPDIRTVFENEKFGANDVARAQRAVTENIGKKGNSPGAQVTGPTAGSSGVQNFVNTSGRVIFLVNRKGELFPISGMKRGNREGRKKAVKEFSEVDGFEEKQYGYLVFKDDKGKSSPLEVVISPVRLNEGDSLAGALLTGQLIESSRTMAMGPGASGGNQGKGGGNSNPPKGPRLGETGRIPLVFAMYVEGELFFADTDSSEEESAMKAAVEAAIANPSIEQRITLKGKPYRVFTGNLTSDNATLPPSYQVVLYPLDGLLADLRDLRYMGSGIGLAAMLFGLLLAWLLSRNIARPILELVAGTQEIHKGNFETRVHPRSHDEIGELAISFNEMAEGLEMREQLRDVLGKVADSAVAQALIEGNLELGGETRVVSVLFCDIRGFTSLTESMSPAEVIDLVNGHMTAMTEIVYRHNGVVDKFVGDEIMAVFGAPKSYGNDAMNAVNCAREMMVRRIELNKDNPIPLDVGIGIATGEVIVGCMGSVDRLNYTVLGERVNRAARLCSIAGAGEAIMDETTANESSGLQNERLNPVRLKGYSVELEVFRVTATVLEATQRVPQLTR